VFSGVRDEMDGAVAEKKVRALTGVQAPEVKHVTKIPRLARPELVRPSRTIWGFIVVVLFEDAKDYLRGPVLLLPPACVPPACKPISARWTLADQQGLARAVLDVREPSP